MVANGPLWLVGAGPMARDYAEVLAALDVSFEVIGRGDASAMAFEESTGRRVERGGVDALLEIRNDLPSTA
ncbi:uncharacterized protein METZ01_LOCUS180281, partial [marine metagenome]